jgi:hypothetical protein
MIAAQNTVPSMLSLMPAQDMADDERALRQALAGLEAALKGDLQTLAAFREVRKGADCFFSSWVSALRLPPSVWLGVTLPHALAARSAVVASAVYPEHRAPLLPQKAVGLLHDTELVVRTFQRAHRWRTAGQVRGDFQHAAQLRVPTDPVAPGLWMMSVAEQTGPFGTTSDENNPSCHPCTDTAPPGFTCMCKSQRAVATGDCVV